MTIKGPFIEKFKSKNYYYIYDVNTNHFIQVDQITWDIIDFFNILSDKEIVIRFSNIYPNKKIYEALTKLNKISHEKHVFTSKRPNDFNILSDYKDINQRLNNNLGHLVLNVTELCNMRCDYCIFSGKYEYRRTHSSNQMRWSLAKNAIDYFFKKNKARNEIYISFFGGEPLLEFSLIKKCIEYTESLALHRKISFTITTNGTLISDEIAKIFSFHNVLLLVSLDGPPQINNLYRKYINGKGSYRNVISSLFRLKKHYGGTYKDLIKLSMVYVPSYDLIDIYEFIKNHERIFKGLDLYFEYCSEDSNIFLSHISDRNKSYIKQKEYLFKIYYDAVINESINTIPGANFLHALFDAPFYRLQNRIHYRSLNKSHYPNSICIPGENKLFVNTKGEFFICEKLDSYTEIGNLENGLDVNNIIRIIDEYSKNCNEFCLDCWLVRLCPLCFKDAIRGNVFDEEMKKQKCEEVKISYSKAFKEYNMILEKNKNAFNFLTTKNK